jgi:hypothetical protein
MNRGISILLRYKMKSGEKKKKSEKERIEGHPEIKCWDIINVLIYK